MRLELMTDADWQLFLDWAAGENWRVPEREQRLFKKRLHAHFYVLLVDDAVQGFVSAVPYRESGWIGNLLVNPERRGLGYGSALFDFALEILCGPQLKRIWLTASSDGMPIYQRRGFVSIDRIERWQGTGLGHAVVERKPLLPDLIRLDQECWGEFRGELLTPLADESEICASGETLALLQPDNAAWQLGPWLSPEKCPRENRLLLTQVLEKTPAGRPLVADLLSGADTGPLLQEAGFHKTGENELMCLGDARVKLDGVVALASLGSIG